MNQLYEGCLIGKQLRKFFSKETTSRAKRQFDFLDVDACGPINQAYMGRKDILCFFFSYDFSMETWMCFLEVKDEVCEAFKKFKAFYRGSEFTLKVFKNTTKKNGIRRPLTFRRSPQKKQSYGKKKPHYSKKEYDKR